MQKVVILFISGREKYDTFNIEFSQFILGGELPLYFHFWSL
jgi:hypothetical protein